MNCTNCGSKREMKDGVCEFCLKVDLKYRAKHTVVEEIPMFKGTLEALEKLTRNV